MLVASVMGASSPVPSGGGITKLSELIIDADKDWGGHGISEIKEIAAGSTRGCLYQRNGGVMVKIAPTNHGDELTSQGPGNAIAWLAPPAV